MDVAFAASFDFGKLCVGPYIQNLQLIKLYVIILKRCAQSFEFQP
jgi:hypothetical protein